MQKTVLGVMLFGLLVPTLAFASPVVRSGESVTVTEDQAVEEDFYAAAGAVTVSGSVAGDVVVAGGTITVNAPIGADLIAAAGTVQLHSTVADDVRVAGGDITLADEIKGDLIVFGGVLRVLSTAHVAGDIIFGGGEMVIEGPVGGSVVGATGRARIDSSVGGDVDIRAGEGLALGDRAEILGDVIYTGDRDIERAQGAVVVGDIQTHASERDSSAEIQAVAVTLFSVLFVALLAYLLFRRQLGILVQEGRHSYGKDGLIGLAVLLGVPFVSVVLMVSVLGLFAGIFLLACYVALLIAAWVVAGVLAGSLFMQLFSRHGSVTLVSVVVGVSLLQILVLVPFIGWLLGFAAILIGLGSIATRLYHLIR